VTGRTTPDNSKDRFFSITRIDRKCDTYREHRIKSGKVNFTLYIILTKVMMMFVFGTHYLGRVHG